MPKFPSVPSNGPIRPRTTSSQDRREKGRGRFQRFFSVLGPGLVTGASDDDPSGIATYSMAGALLGTSLLWTAFVTWPLMASVQFTCAKIGMVTGRGIGSVLLLKFPRWMVMVSCLALFGANALNVGADLSGMADATAMLTHSPSRPWVFIYGFGIAWATIRFRYRRIAGILKWLALVLLAYVITAFLVKPSWPAVAQAAIVPTIPRNHDGWSMLVAILGTTISPYLFFWQASQEVEEDKAKGRKSIYRRLGATQNELDDRWTDVATGTAASNVVMFFIILTAALTLHRSGLTQIQTSQDAATALYPLAGNLAGTLFTLGIVGVGVLAIPTLTSSAAYALADVFRLRQGLDERLDAAPAFYGTILFSTAIGIGLVFGNVNPVQALYWTAIVNGLLAPFLLLGILMVASDRKIMQKQPISRLSFVLASVTTLLMFAAGGAMFVF